MAYFLPLENGKRQPVCKAFFLATLGFSPTNDGPVHSAVGVLTASKETRGRSIPPNRVSRDVLRAHIERYEPVSPHYRYLHAPRRRYLPADLTASDMYRHFVEEHGNICTYETFRKTLKEANISFTRLGSEECDICKTYSIH